jgi:hypothetical protein
MSLGVLLVFDWRVAELVRLGSEQMGWKWLNNRHGGYLGTDLLGEENALLDVASQHRAQLCHFTQPRRPVEPRHQRILQCRRDVQLRQRVREHVDVAAGLDHPRTEDGLGQLLDVDGAKVQGETGTVRGNIVYEASRRTPYRRRQSQI